VTSPIGSSEPIEEAASPLVVLAIQQIKSTVDEVLRAAQQLRKAPVEHFEREGEALAGSHPAVNG
jgi:hypothetical protein